jgi:NADPH:quinone reductase-like Zn-dependent oxidoreductase
MPSEITFATFGGPDVLQWTADAEMPDPLPSQVVIVVAAAAVMTLDAKIRAGELSDTVSTFLPSGAGRDVAGVVIARGRAVRDIGVGDEVLGFSDTGAYAQFAALTTYARKPRGLSWAEAACIPTPSSTALRVLDELKLVAGEVLLVTGGGGAVASFAIQIARSRGIQVIATCSAADDAYMRLIGATPVRYGLGWADRVRAVSPRGVDAAFDTSGARLVTDLIALAGGPRRVITISDNTAHIYGVRLSPDDALARSPKRLDDVAQLVASGALDVRIARQYPLSKAAKAHRDLASGGTRGRLVLVNGA